MKRSLLALVAVSAVALVACEPQDTAVEEIPAADETQEMTDTVMPMQPDTAMMDTAMMGTDTPQM